MTRKRIGLGGLIPVHFETLALSDSTALALSSTAQTDAHVLLFSVEDNHVRMRADGTDPALTTGVLYQKDNTYIFHGYNGTSVMKFQRSTGTANVAVQSYKHE